MRCRKIGENFQDIQEKLDFEHLRMTKEYLMAKLDEKIRNCHKCRLHKTRVNAVPGEGPVDAKIMICGQAPGRTEDVLGRPFTGVSGTFLNKLLRLIKISRESLFITSSLKCFPPNNRPPKSDELKICRHYLEEQIKIINPKIIIALGNSAIQTLLNKKSLISLIHGEPREKNGIIIFPTFHPAAAMRFPKIRILIKEDFKKFKDILKKFNLI